MRKHRPTMSRWRTLALVSALLLVVAACAGSGTDTTTSTTEGNQTTTTAAPGTTTTTEGGINHEDRPFELGVIHTPESKPPPAELVAAAEAEGEVYWYTGSTTFELVIEAFESMYDIEVIPNRQNSGAITALYMQEAEAGAVVADVLQAFNPPMFEAAAEAGYFAPLDSSVMTNLQDIPSELVSEFWVPSNSWVWGWVYNTERVDAPPGPNWVDIADPKYDGEIIMQDPRTGGLTAGIVYWMYQAFGEQFLRDLGELNLRWVPSNVAGLDPLAAGEAMLVIPTNSNNPDPLIEQGAPLQFMFPADGNTSWFSHDLAISADARNPNAARLLANFLMSVEVQEGVAFAGPPVHPMARTDLELGDNLYQLTYADVQAGEAMLDQFIEWLQIED